MDANKKREFVKAISGDEPMNETGKEKDHTLSGSAWLDKIITEEFDPQWKAGFEQMILKLFPEMNDHPFKRAL